MAPSLKSLASKLNRVQEKRKTLAGKVIEFEKALLDTFAGTRIYGVSADVTLEQTGEDDYVYGHLSFSEVGGLSVAHRTTDDDYHDQFVGTPPDQKSYDIRHISICSSEWLERVFVDETVTSILKKLDRTLDEMDGVTNQTIDVLEKSLEEESAEINAQMVETLKQIGDEPLNKIWTKAHEAVHFDLADSLTRNSSFLESVCTYILKERDQPLPQTKTIATLIDEAIRALDWPTDKNVEGDVKKITGGVKSICAGIGSLRTHFGTAHGSTDQALDASFATLTNNASAAIAIFLLRRHLKRRN